VHVDGAPGDRGGTAARKALCRQGCADSGPQSNAQCLFFDSAPPARGGSRSFKNISYRAGPGYS
jgi:hypothetical protein